MELRVDENMNEEPCNTGLVTFEVSFATSVKDEVENFGIQIILSASLFERLNIQLKCELMYFSNTAEQDGRYSEGL